jgi:hypothetical protein
LCLSSEKKKKNKKQKVEEVTEKRTLIKIPRTPIDHGVAHFIFRSRQKTKKEEKSMQIYGRGFASLPPTPSSALQTALTGGFHLLGVQFKKHETRLFLDHFQSIVVALF